LKGLKLDVQVRTDTKKHATEVSKLALGENLCPRGFPDTMLLLHGFDNVIALPDDLWVVERSFWPFETSKDFHPLLYTTMGDQPSRGLGQERESDEDDDSKKGLQGNGPSPGES
jgi:hypothetical protein